jgi:hypothetical protein
MSLSDLERMIQGQRRALRKLERLRAAYQRKLDAVDRRIAAIGGNGRVRGGRRARNEVSLPDAIANVLSRAASPVGVGDIVQKVQAAGYRSGSANFRGIVNQALIKDRRFVSVERGVYRLRASGQSNGKARAARRKKSTSERPADNGTAEGERRL